MPKRAMKDVVVVLPGILGSVLERDGKDIWAISGGAAVRSILTLGDSMDQLALHGDDPDVDDLGDGITAPRLMPDLHLIPGLWKIDGYGAITKSIRSTFDVTPGENYFEFPYDWRRDNRVHGRRLRRQSRTWLTEWRETSGNADAKLILLAHSMGGLVSRAFLELEGGWRDTRALITFGTPFRGSLDALGFIANGFKKGIGPFGVDLTDMLRSFTSVYQLLPIYPCFDLGDGSLQRTGEGADIPNLDPVRARDALAFHRSIEAAVASNLGETDAENRYRIYPIVGIAQPTIQSALLDGDRLRMLATIAGRDDGGDGTVPRASATPLEYDDSRLATFSAARHSSLQNTSSALAQVEGVLTAGQVPDIYRRSDAQLSLRIEDVYDATEPARFAARTSRQGGSVRIEVLPTEQPAPPVAVHMQPAADGWVEGESELATGTYRITARDESAAEPVSDLIVVV